MKRILALLLVLLMVFTVVSCTKKEEAPASMDVATPAENATAGDAVAAAANKYFADLPADIEKVDNKEFVQMVKDGKDMVIVDIRSKEDYDKGHVKGAINIPWGPAIAENLKNLPQGTPIYTYCYTGQTCGQAVVTWNVAGIDAKSVHLGWNMGITKVEGYEAIVDTTPIEIKPMNTSIDPAIQEAVNKYYAGFGAAKDAGFANYKVAEDQLKALVDAKDTSIYILDIRKAEDFAKGHIEGANNLAFGKGMQDGFTNLPKDKKIVVVCYTGQTAGQTTAALRLLGYDAVSLNGGMGSPANAPMGWLNKDYPVVQ